MNIPETETAMLEQRKAELADAVKAEDADLDAIEKEAREIVAELEKREADALKAAEKRKAVADGEAAITKITKIEKEERKMFEVNSIEYRDAWIHELQGRLSVEERAGYTQTSTYATNAIPTEVADIFFAKLKKTAPMLNEITLMRAAGNLKFVVQGTRNAAGKHTENNAENPAADITIAVTLGAVEFMKVVGISKSAMLMSVPEFIGWLADYLAEDIARAIDDYILNDSTNGVGAITWTSGTNAVYASTYGYATIASAIALLPASYDGNAKFVMNKATLWSKAANITNSAGNPIFIADAAEGFAGKILGYPVLVDDYVGTAKGDIYLADFKNIVGNLSEGPVVERSNESGFRNGTIDYRGYVSFDSKPARTDAFVRIATTA